jgi:hypothetical protein
VAAVAYWSIARPTAPTESRADRIERWPRRYPCTRALAPLGYLVPAGLDHREAHVILTRRSEHIVAARLGNRAETVLATYAHLLPQSDELAAERVALALAVD